jgi:hypothetical protein
VTGLQMQISAQVSIEYPADRLDGPVYLTRIQWWTWLLAAAILLWAPGSAPFAHGLAHIQQGAQEQETEAETSEGASGDADLGTRAHDAVTRPQDAQSSPPASAPPKRINEEMGSVAAWQCRVLEWVGSPPG